MKVELDEKGVLIIKAESSVESFALSHWHRMWENNEVCFLVETVAIAADGSGELDRNYREINSGSLDVDS